MIEVARETVGGNMTWHTANATELPFDEDSFDLAFCQQGLQFIPDKPSALKEMRRVLRPGGRAVLTVWSEISPLFVAIGEGLTKHMGSKLAQRAAAPFSFRDGQVIEDLLREAGFGQVDMRVLTVTRRIDPITQSLPRELAGSPIGQDFDKADEASKAALIDDVDLALKGFREDGGVAIPQRTHLVVAQ